MYKNNIKNQSLKKIYYIINEINDEYPLWWQEFSENIILKSHITFINHTTLIIGIYELAIQDLIILYNILKHFKKNKLLTKVINKKEFLIIHVNNEKTMEYLINPVKWLNLVVYKYLSEEYDLNCLILEPEKNETLRFIYRGTVYHFYTEPLEEIKSNKYHKYVYLYKDMYVKYVNLLDNQLKYVRNRHDFLKNFKEIIEKNN